MQPQPRSAASVAAAPGVGRPAPTGLGLDSAAVRARMVQRLRAGGLQHEAVLQALASTERHRFVDSALATQAYEDTSLPIGLQQTISKPSVVGHMLALLFEGAHAREHGHLGRTLEIGTGCGYQAALLLQLASSVVSIERLQALHDKARAHLHALRSQTRADLRLVLGDGRLGHAPRAPYHSIIAAAGGDALPSAWTDQLAVGGRLVAPMADGQGDGGPAVARTVARTVARAVARTVVPGQRLLVVDRSADGLVTQYLDAVHFVPLKSGIE